MSILDLLILSIFSLSVVFVSLMLVETFKKLYEREDNE